MMKSALTPKQVRIQTLQAQQEALGASIERSRRSLDSTSQYDVDDFNRMVNHYNALNEEIKPLINEFNREVDRFNSELERVGTLR
jgi:wobble nucleotide-excising tRNase